MSGREENRNRAGILSILIHGAEAAEAEAIYLARQLMFLVHHRKCQSSCLSWGKGSARKNDRAAMISRRVRSAMRISRPKGLLQGISVPPPPFAPLQCLLKSHRERVMEREIWSAVFHRAERAGRWIP